MQTKNIDEEVSAFCEMWQGLHLVYEDYARSVGIPYTTLYILAMVERTGGCTQREMRDRTLLPKQSVNAVVTGLYKKGLVTLEETPGDRRAKAVRLTDKGKRLVDEVIPPIHEAERAAMSRLSREQGAAMLSAMGLYCGAFREAMGLPEAKD